MLRGLVLDYAGVLTEAGAERLLRALDAARGHDVRTALLSNAAEGEEVRAHLGEWFDALVFSGEAGCAKPDVRIYEVTARRLGLAASECVFVDDSVRNVAGAVEAGMVGVRHVSVERTLAELAVLVPDTDPGIG